MPPPNPTFTRYDDLPTGADGQGIDGAQCIIGSADPVELRRYEYVLTKGGYVVGARPIKASS
jgi:hypothetical protein